MERSLLNVANLGTAERVGFKNVKQDIYRAYNDASAAIQRYAAYESVNLHNEHMIFSKNMILDC